MMTTNFIAWMIISINAARANDRIVGAPIPPALIESSYLDAEALKRAKQLVSTKTFNHNGFYQWSELSVYLGPYYSVGENLARGYNGDPIKIVEAFRNSPSHKAIMEDPRYDAVGAAHVGDITVVEFGASKPKR